MVDIQIHEINHRDGEPQFNIRITCSGEHGFLLEFNAMANLDSAVVEMTESWNSLAARPELVTPMLCSCPLVV
ncbi:MAG: hypothetical protein HY835_07460 [Anaerolineae bacterium]|nr:hypothetical protein [Anaerolineae bacterium]